MDTNKPAPIKEALEIANDLSTGFSYSSNVASRYAKKQCDRLLEILYGIDYHTSPETTLDEELDKITDIETDTFITSAANKDAAHNLAERLRYIDTNSTRFQRLTIEADQKDLIIVYGASDDLCEFLGAYDEENSAYEGGTHVWNGVNFIVLEEDERLDPNALYIRQSIADPEDDIYWKFDTNIKNTARTTFKEDDYLSEGLVVPMSSLSQRH